MRSCNLLLSPSRVLSRTRCPAKYIPGRLHFSSSSSSPSSSNTSTLSVSSSALRQAGATGWLPPNLTQYADVVHYQLMSQHRPLLQGHRMIQAQQLNGVTAYLQNKRLPVFMQASSASNRTPISVDDSEYREMLDNFEASRKSFFDEPVAVAQAAVGPEMNLYIPDPSFQKTESAIWNEPHSDLPAIIMEDPTASIGGGPLQAESILKWRRKKITKHKFKKWRKRTRAYRRKHLEKKKKLRLKREAELDDLDDLKREKRLKANKK